MAIKTLADVQTVWNGDKVKAQIKRASGKGVLAAAVFYESRLKEILSVPAPRRTVKGRRGRNTGLTYYRATTPATRGAPPRKLSGELRRRQTHEVRDNGRSVRVGSNVVYAGPLEKRLNHRYMVPTLLRFKGALVAIVGRGGFNQGGNV